MLLAFVRFTKTKNRANGVNRHYWYTHINFNWFFLFTGIVKKNFQGSTRSSIRKDLGLMLKKARANKENRKQNKP